MITIDEQIAEVKRELAMRARVYPRLVEAKKLKWEDGDRRIALLGAVLDTLEQLRDEQAANVTPGLFDPPTARRPFPPALTRCGRCPNAHGCVVSDKSNCLFAVRGRLA